MTIHLIIGKDSNLSKSLNSGLENSVLLSARDIMQGKINFKSYIGEPVNVILNNFQPATALNDVSHPDKYIEAAILSTAKTLDLLKTSSLNVQRLIYTSSSSVYGDNILCRESDTLKPMSLHAALKVANEKLVGKFCLDHGFSFVITRIFNMYGREDRFSVVSKIISAYRKGETLPIVNHGNSIRDFIHIDDVVRIYTQLLLMKNTPTMMNIGSGIGHSISGIIEFLNNHAIEISTSNGIRDEVKISTACIETLQSYCSLDSMIDVNEYILEQLKAL